MAQFQIKRGYKRYLIDENNAPLIPLEEGCWYLALDTAEIYVAINQELKKLNESEIDLDIFDERFGSIEERLTNLENKSEPLRFAERQQFPTVGDTDKLYIAIDENQLYIFIDNEYVAIGGSSSEDLDIKVINGGDAVD